MNIYIYMYIYMYKCVYIHMHTYAAAENMAHIRHSRPDSGLGFHVKVLKSVLA